MCIRDRDQTQTALAGWRKVLNLLDEPVEVVEADPGVTLALSLIHISEPTRPY